MNQGSPFKQVTLSEEQLEAGLLQSVDGVRIPWDAVAMTALRAEDFERTLGISFQASFDDLDEGHFAVLELGHTLNIALKDYPGSPVAGTRIYADLTEWRSGGQLDAVLDGLGLSREQLTWIADGVS